VYSFGRAAPLLLVEV